MPDEATLPRWLIIVRRARSLLYQHLRESYTGDDRVEVIVNRRATLKVPMETNLRRAGRRIRDRRAVAPGDRRQAERRQTLATPQQHFWVTEGFFMVRRGSGAPAS